MSLRDFNPRTLDFSGLINPGHVDPSMLPGCAAPSTMGVDVDDEFIRQLDHFTDLAEQGDFLLDIDPADGDELLAAVAQQAGFKASPGLPHFRPRPAGSAVDGSPLLKLFPDGRMGLNGLAPAQQARLAAGQLRPPAELAQDVSHASTSDQAVPCLGASDAAMPHQRQGAPSNSQALLDSLYKLQQQQQHQQQQRADTSGIMPAMPAVNPSSGLPGLLAPRGMATTNQSSIWASTSAGDAAALATAAAATATAPTHISTPNISITPALSPHRPYAPWPADSPAAPPSLNLHAGPNAPAAAPPPTLGAQALAGGTPVAPAGMTAEQHLGALREMAANLPDAQLLEGLLQGGSGGLALGEAVAAALQAKGLQQQQQQQHAAAFKPSGLAAGLSSLGQAPPMTHPQAGLGAPPPLNLLPPGSRPHLVPPPSLARQIAQATAQQQQASDALLASLFAANGMDTGDNGSAPTLTRPIAPAAKARRFVAGDGGPITISQEFLDQQCAARAAAMAAAPVDGMHSIWGDDHMLPSHVVLPTLPRPASTFTAPCQPGTPTLPLRSAQPMYGVQATAAISGSGSDTSTKEAHGAPCGMEEDDLQEVEGGAALGDEEGEEGVTSSLPAGFALDSLGGGPRREITRVALREVYDYPINEAAKRLGVGVTVLKKYCRKFEIPRWPYRKLKSMEKLIESVQDYASQDPEMTSTVLAELCSFRDMIYEDPSIDLEARIKKLRQANFKLEYKQRQCRGSSLPPAGPFAAPVVASASAAAAPAAAGAARAAGKRGPSLRSSVQGV